MPTLKDIKEQIKNLPHKYIFYTKREINYLPKILAEDEKILALTSGYHGNTTMLLVCTNRRLLFVDKGMFFGLKVKQLNLDRIQSIDSSYIIVFGNIKIWDAAAAYDISLVLKDSIEPFVKTVRQAIDDYKKLVFNEITGQRVAQPQHTQAIAEAYPQSQQYPSPQPQHMAPPLPPPQAQTYSTAPSSAPAAPTKEDMVSKLERLAKLREQGHLTEEEFQHQKAKLLSSI